MIRVLHIVLSLETGGLENGVVNLVNHADTTVFHVDVLCLRAQGALAQRVPPEQVLFTQPAVAIAAAIKRIYQVCRAGGYDIVHTHGWATLLAGFIGARLARVPVVINGEHGVLYDQSRLQRWLQRCLFNAVTLNLSVCDDLVKLRSVLPSINNYFASSLMAWTRKNLPLMLPCVNNCAINSSCRTK